MKDFLIENWKFLICIALALIEILYLIFHKKVRVDTLKEEILAALPVAIMTAEKTLGPGCGSEKLAFCLDFIKKTIQCPGNSLDGFICRSIENILSTPEKKGINNG